MALTSTFLAHAGVFWTQHRSDRREATRLAHQRALRHAEWQHERATAVAGLIAEWTRSALTLATVEQAQQLLATKDLETAAADVQQMQEKLLTHVGRIHVFHDSPRMHAATALAVLGFSEAIDAHREQGTESTEFGQANLCTCRRRSRSAMTY